METDGIRRIVDGIRAVLAGRIFVGEAVERKILKHRARKDTCDQMHTPARHVSLKG